jgi:acetyl esterase/lipase
MTNPSTLWRSVLVLVGCGPLSLCARADMGTEAITAIVREPTPRGLPGSRTFVYRSIEPEPVRLHVFLPSGWTARDRRPALLYFFSGGWIGGSPAMFADWGRWAAGIGLVGIIPDYRTRNRFGTSPREAVADGRASLRWVQDHAGELGIDSRRIVVGGSSAGGHLALWTAITRNPPGSSSEEAPLIKPCALVLVSPVSDTAGPLGYAPRQFGGSARAFSPVDQLDPVMPPLLVFHGDADQTVPVGQSINLRDKLSETGNSCELVVGHGGGHSFISASPEWTQRVRTTVEDFLKRQHVLPAVLK